MKRTQNSKIAPQNSIEGYSEVPQLKPLKIWDKNQIQDLSDQSLFGIIARQCAIFLTFFSPIISSADLTSNIYYITTQKFRLYQLKNAFIFFLCISLIVQTIVWTYRHINMIYLQESNQSFRLYLNYRHFQMTKTSGPFYKYFFLPICIGVPYVVGQFCFYLPEGMVLGFLSELNILPILMQFKMGEIITKRQIDTFKFYMQDYYSKDKSSARMDKISELEKNFKGHELKQKIEEYELEQQRQMFTLPASPEERAEIFVQSAEFYEIYAKSELVQKLQVTFDQIQGLLKTMPLLILRYVNIIDQNRQDETYSLISIIISSLSISWTAITFINSIFESQIDPIYWIYNLRQIKKKVMKDKMKLLPNEAVKRINLTLDSNREIPRIISIGSADENFFQTVQDITVTFDGSERFENWGRDQTDFFKAVGNIMQLVKDNNHYFGIDFEYDKMDLESKECLSYLLDNKNAQIKNFIIRCPGTTHQSSEYELPNQLICLSVQGFSIQNLRLNSLDNLQMLHLYIHQDFDSYAKLFSEVPKKCQVLKIFQKLPCLKIEEIYQSFQQRQKKELSNFYLEVRDTIVSFQEQESNLKELQQLLNTNTQNCSLDLFLHGSIDAQQYLNQLDKAYFTQCHIQGRVTWEQLKKYTGIDSIQVYQGVRPSCLFRSDKSQVQQKLKGLSEIDVLYIEPMYLVIVIKKGISWCSLSLRGILDFYLMSHHKHWRVDIIYNLRENKYICEFPDMQLCEPQKLEELYIYMPYYECKRIEDTLQQTQKT